MLRYGTPIICTITCSTDSMHPATLMLCSRMHEVRARKHSFSRLRFYIVAFGVLSVAYAPQGAATKQL